MKYLNVAIGIVLYNPDIEKLVENINRLKEITDSIYFVDNGSDNVNKIKEVLKEFSTIKVIYNDENLGIAKALNQLLFLSIDNNKDFLLTLDQDSKMNIECFKNLYKYHNISKVAIICPIINDLNKVKSKTIKEEYKFINRCITSGSLMNLQYCQIIGDFDEKMFIDYVDFDYCKQVNLHGFKIIMVRDAILDHEVGKRTKKKFLFFTVYPTNHSPKRVFYYARNVKYFLYKDRGKLSFKEYFHDVIHLTWKYVNILLYEENKKEKLDQFHKGLQEYKLGE